MKLFRSLSFSKKSTKRRPRASTTPSRHGSVAIRNKDGLPLRDFVVLRIFLPDETYRAIKPTPKMTCGDVIDTVWPRLHLDGRREDYALYVIYKLGDAQFVGDEVEVDKLNQNPWDSVVKIYLRYKDDSSMPEEGIDGEILIPRDRLNTFGHMKSNPYFSKTGDLFKLKQKRTSIINAFQLSFRNAWKKGSQLSQDEPLPSPTDPDAIFQRSDHFESPTEGRGYWVGVSEPSPIESGYGTLRSVMYSTIGSLDRTAAEKSETGTKFRFNSENAPLMLKEISNSRAVADDEMSNSSFSTFRSILDSSSSSSMLKRKDSDLDHMAPINDFPAAIDFPPPPPPVVLSRELTPELPPPPPQNSLTVICDALPPPPSLQTLQKYSIFGSTESLPLPPSPQTLQKCSIFGSTPPPSPAALPPSSWDLPPPPDCLDEEATEFFPPPPPPVVEFPDNAY